MQNIFKIQLLNFILNVEIISFVIILMLLKLGINNNFSATVLSFYTLLFLKAGNPNTPFNKRSTLCFLQ